MKELYTTIIENLEKNDAQLLQLNAGAAVMYQSSYIETNNLVEKKNFFHQVVNEFGYAGLLLVKNSSLLGRAYYNACQYDLAVYDQINLPTAREIFTQYGKLLKKLSCEKGIDAIPEEIRNLIIW